MLITIPKSGVQDRTGEESKVTVCTRLCLQEAHLCVLVQVEERLHVGEAGRGFVTSTSDSM